MSSLYIWIIVLGTSIVLFLFNHFYVFNKANSAKIQCKDITPIYNNPILGTGNMIGITIQKGSRFDYNTGACAGYSFLTILLPIIPINCYLLKETGYHRESHKKATTYYKFYGRLPWNIWEILFIYLWWYPLAFGVISIISIISIMCES